jgi:two-component system, sensor histidine kinase
VTHADDVAAREQRLVILAPTRRDALLTESLLASADLPCLICSTIAELVAAVRQGAAAMLIAEEMIVGGGLAALKTVLARQPAWSDLPVLVLTRPGADSVDVVDAVRTLGNVTLLERPIRVATLMSAVRSAVRARERQYQIRGHLADRERAEVLLRDADRRKDEFLATLGHELRNPLAPLLTGLQLLKLAGLTDPRSLRTCTVMERQVAHLVRLVEDLLQVSRITRGVIEVRKEPLELGAVLRAAIDTSRPSIEDAQQTLAVDVPADPIAIAGDAIRLTQVFANLLNNASKYTDHRGQIWVSAKATDNWAEVSVRDNGIGIPPSQLSTVFDMFMQVDRTQRRTQGGLGIGLTLVRSLVSMHGGTVDARSQGIGMGSEFLVRLPVLHDALLQPSVGHSVKPFPSQRIMIVDDNRDAAESLSALLSALGAKVTVVHSGPDALDALDTADPDAVLLDIGMPGTDGYDVARQIRSTAAHADVLLIALTGWGQDEDRARSIRAGFDHHLVKPPDIDRLRSLLVEREANFPAKRRRVRRG